MRVLYVLSALGGGGVDRIAYDYCTRMSDEVHFDFVVFDDKVGMLEKKLKENGCNIYHICSPSRSFLHHVTSLNKIIKNGKFDIIHSHLGFNSFLVLFIAKLRNVKVRIAHAHIAFIPESFIQHKKRKIFTTLTKQFATELYACGTDAGKWNWGDANFHIMHNAINVSEFAFDDTVRNAIRKELNLTGKFVVGNVGRFSRQKNHAFLIQIFKQLHDFRPDSMLLLIGSGDLFDEIQEKVRELKINDAVIFAGERNDVKNLLNAMDVFLLPSLYEGLPVVLVEAQGNGLPIVASDTITKEIKIAENIEYLSLDSPISEWNNALVTLERSKSNVLVDSIYDIDTEAKRQQNNYFRRVSEKMITYT